MLDPQALEAAWNILEPLDFNRSDLRRAITAYLSALPSSAPRIQAETKGEVVAWMLTKNDGEQILSFHEPTDGDLSHGWMPSPLYLSALASPVAAVPQDRAGIERLRKAAQHVYDRLTGPEWTVTIIDQEILGDALRAISPTPPVPDRAEIIEECAKVADDAWGSLLRYAHEPDPSPDSAWDYACQKVAADIRSLSDSKAGE